MGSRMLPTVRVPGTYDSHSLKRQLLAHTADAVLLGLVTQGHLSCHVWFAVLHPLNCPCDTPTASPHMYLGLAMSQHRVWSKETPRS